MEVVRQSDMKLLFMRLHVSIWKEEEKNVHIGSVVSGCLE